MVVVATLGKLLLLHGGGLNGLKIAWKMTKYEKNNFNKKIFTQNDAVRRNLVP